MNQIFNNPQQNGLSAMNESEQTLAAFDKWYNTLPKWSEEEMLREAEDQINEDIKNNKQ